MGTERTAQTGGGPVATSSSSAGPGRAHDLSTLRRGIEILEVLQQWAWCEDAHGWGNNRIADYLGADKSQVSRTLKVLTEAGWVERDPERKTYRLGPAIYSLGMRAADQPLMRVGAQVVRRAVAMTGCRVFLVVRRGDRAVTVWSDQPPEVQPVVASIGMMYPVAGTETGRALLYGSSPDEIREILGYSGLDEPALDRFVARVRQDRDAGHSYGVLDDRSCGIVAVPIWTTGRKVVATLGAASPVLVDPANVAPVARTLLAAAAEITRQHTAAARAEVGVSAVPYQGWPARPELAGQF